MTDNKGELNMQSIQTILFVSQDDSIAEQTLFSWALHLAEQNQAHLKVLRVLPEMSPGLAAWLNNAAPLTLMEQQKQIQLLQLQPLQQQAQETNVSFSVEVVFGKVFYKIIQQVLKIQADLVIKLVDTPCENNSRSLFGSNDMHLLRKCPCALLLHKPQSKLPFVKVIASIDVDIDNEQALKAGDLNTRIMDWTVKLHQPQSAPLEVVHVWQSEAENLASHWNTDWSDKDLLLFNEQAHQCHKIALESALQPYRLPGTELQTYLPKGEPEIAIAQLLKNHGNDLLVMGTIARTGISGLIIGNTAENILEQVNCSVLAVKPKGFESPIKLETLF